MFLYVELLVVRIVAFIFSLRNTFLKAVAFTFLFASSTFASPAITTYQAKIIKPDGYPLEASNVNFKFTILNPAATCILYSESYSTVNMANTAGVISFALGSGIKTYPVSATTFKDVFSNVTPSLSCDAGGPVSYSPQADDVRKIVMQFNDGSGWQTLPAMAINAVPYAMYADEAQSLNGFSDADFVKTSTLTTCGASEALRFNGASFSCVAVGNAGAITSGDITTALGYTPATGASFTALSSSLSTTDATLTSVSSTVFSVSSTVTSLSNTVASSFAAITSSQWSSVASGISYTGGNVGIGTADPAAPLEIFSTTTGGGVNLVKQMANGWSTGFNVLKRGRTGDNTAAITNGSEIGYHGFYGWDGVSFSRAAYAIARAAEDFSAGRHGGTYSIATTAIGANDAIVRMTIDASGSVGIGATPNATLHTWTSSSATVPVFVSALSEPYGLVSSTRDAYIPAGTLVKIHGSGTNTTSGGALIDFLARTPAGTATNIYVGAVAGSSANGPANFVVGRRTSTSAWQESLRVDTSGNLGVGTSAPTARLQLAAGTTTNAPLKLTSGTLLTSPQSGTLEYDGSQLYFTDSSNTRRSIATNSAAGSFENTSSITNASGNITLTPNEAAGSVIVSATTASTNANTGSLVVKGGLGVAGDINTAANLNVSGSSVIGGTLSLSTMNSGSVLFAANNGIVSQDNANFFWNEANKRLGIGTSTPNSKLSVSGTGVNFYSEGSAMDIGWKTGENLQLGEWNGSTFNERMRITPSGNVSIGVANPIAKLQVAASNTSTLISSVSPVMVIQNTDSTSGALNTLMFLNSGGFGSAALSVVQNSSGNSGDDLILQTKSSTTSWNQNQLVLNSSTGNVGFGTNSPSSTVHVRASTTAELLLQNTGNSDPHLVLDSNRSSPNFGVGSIRGSWNNSVVAAIDFMSGADSTNKDEGYIALRTRGVSDVATATRMVISQEGRVGIGTTNPTTVLVAKGVNSGTGTTVSGDVQAMLHLIDTSSDLGAGPQIAFSSAYNGPTVTITGATIGSFKEVASGTGSDQYNHSLIFKTSNYPDSGPAERLRINSSGNVGIGTSAPTAALHIKKDSAGFEQIFESDGSNIDIGYFKDSKRRWKEYIDMSTDPDDGSNTGSNYQLESYNDNQVSTTRLTILRSSGNVGIGVGIPTAKLHIVAGTSSTAALKFTTGTLLTSPQSGTMEYDGVNFYLTDSANTRLVIATGSSSGTIDNASKINSSGNITMTPVGSVVVSSTTVSTNSSTGSLVVKGGVGVGGNIYASGTIVTSSNIQGASITATSGVSTNIVQGNTNLLLNPNGGNVGIGTISPTSKLQVDGDIFTSTVFRASSNQMSGSYRSWMTSGLLVGASSSDGGYFGMKDEGANAGDTVIAWGDDPGDDLRFIFTASGGALDGDERMRILANGNVGIGTTAPTTKLHVSGSGSATSGLFQLSSTSVNADGTLARLGPYSYVNTTPSGALTFNWGARFDGDTDQWNRAYVAANNYLPYIQLGTDSKVKIGGAVSNTTTDANPTFSDRLVVDVANGNVGIGTTTPTDRLHVMGVVTATSGTANISMIPEYLGSAYIQSYQSVGVFKPLKIDGLGVNFDAKGSSFSFLSGNVGIGTVSPTANLHVYASDTDIAEIAATGSAQGSGVLYVGQSSAFGAGMLYNGDDSPNQLGVSDDVVFFRRDAGVDYEVFKYRYNSDNVTFTGNIGVGTASPLARLHVSGTLRVDSLAAATATQLCIDGNSVLAACSSSIRYKENVLDLDASLATILKLRPVSYDWIKSKEHDVGFIAEEVEQVDSRLVTYNKENKIQGVKYDQLTAPIVKAIQELYYKILGQQENLSVTNAKIQNLELENKVKDRRIQSLEQENAAIKSYLCDKDPTAPICK